MIDLNKVDINTPVLRSRDNHQMIIEQIDTSNPWPFRCRGLGGEKLGRFKANDLDYVVPPTPPQKREGNPHRRFHVTIDIQADDMLALRLAISRINQHFRQETPSNSLISGGYDSGYYVTVTERPEQTHDKFVAELQTYLSALENANG